MTTPSQSFFKGAGAKREGTAPAEARETVAGARSVWPSDDRWRKLLMERGVANRQAWGEDGGLGEMDEREQRTVFNVRRRQFWERVEELSVTERWRTGALARRGQWTWARGGHCNDDGASAQDRGLLGEC